MTITRTYTVAAGLLSGCALMLMQAAQAQEANASDALQEVVVTAEKISQNLVNVPSTINVIEPTQLEEQGITSFADFTKIVPGLDTLNAAAPGHGIIAIRGISTGSTQGSATTGIYIDNIPMTTPVTAGGASNSTVDPDLNDIERIEVLKGPQGTLYGASSMGGLIKVVTTQPSLTTFGGNILVGGGLTDGGGPSSVVRGGINMPLVDGSVALRVSAYDRHDGGFVNNVLTGQRDVNDGDSEGGRIALRIAVNDKIDSTFTASWQELHGDSFAYEFLNPATLRPLDGQKNYTSYINWPYFTRYETVANDTTIDFGFAQLTNDVSSISTLDERTNDYTAPYGRFIPTAPPNSAISADLIPKASRFTDELRLASKPGGPFDYLLGFFYNTEHDSYTTLVDGVNGPTGAPLPPPNGNVYDYVGHVSYWEWAPFADLTYHFSPRLEATVGFRYDSNDQQYSAVRSGVLAGAGPFSYPFNDTRDSGRSYLATISYHPDDSSTLYVRAASGYRPGGVSPIAATGTYLVYRSDNIWNYEAGYKSLLLDRHLSLDVAAFHIDWTNIQLNTIVNGFNLLTNAGDAVVNGAELELQYTMDNGFKFGLNGTEQNTEFASTNVTVGAFEGDPLPMAPRFVANLFTEYDWSLRPGVGARIGADYSYQGSRYSSFSHDPTNTDYKIDSYYILGVHGGVDWSHYALDLRVDNVTNQIGISSLYLLRTVATQVNPVWATVSRPLNAMLTLSAKF